MSTNRTKKAWETALTTLLLAAAAVTVVFIFAATSAASRECEERGGKYLVDIRYQSACVETVEGGK